MLSGIFPKLQRGDIIEFVRVNCSLPSVHKRAYYIAIYSFIEFLKYCFFFLPTFSETLLILIFTQFYLSQVAITTGNAFKLQNYFFLSFSREKNKFLKCEPLTHSCITVGSQEQLIFKRGFLKSISICSMYLWTHWKYLFSLGLLSST